MKLDEIQDNTSKSNVAIKKKESAVTTNGNANSILEMLNPLKSININSDLHAFYNFRESKESVLALLKAQENLVFYVLHQNFMCDSVHKEFFKNMVGRFYDLPEKFWGYFRGLKYIYADNGKEAFISGLVLLENAKLYNQIINGNINFYKFPFKPGTTLDIERIYFNSSVIEHFSGVKCENDNIAKDFYCSNNKNLLKATTFYGNITHFTFENEYEYGRFCCNSSTVQLYSSESNFWYIPKQNNFSKSNYKVSEKYPYLANFELVKFKVWISYLKDGIEFIEYENSKYNTDEIKLIHSLSQTFQWTKDYIFDNYEFLNMDVLGLNMTVPWDMELVKFFIKKGYGGRMSENKAVFDLVFKPLLTDEILEMLFKLEYEKY